MSEKEIRLIVDNVLKETEMISIPIEVVAIANFYGFRVYEIPMDDNVSGMIISDKENIKNFDTNKIIVVNANHAQTRKRFTVAHELGHYILQGQPQECYAHRDSGVYSEAEKDANSFASALLMPEKDVLNEIEQLKSIYGNISDAAIEANIANKFNVSKSAADVRIKKLMLFKEENQCP